MSIDVQHRDSDTGSKISGLEYRIFLKSIACTLYSDLDAVCMGGAVPAPVQVSAKALAFLRPDAMVGVEENAVVDVLLKERVPHHQGCMQHTVN